MRDRSGRGHKSQRRKKIIKRRDESKITTDKGDDGRGVRAMEEGGRKEECKRSVSI